MWACYVIDHNGNAFEVCTTDASREATFADRIAILDQAVATLRFD
jgi:hypothetical protein